MANALAGIASGMSTPPDAKAPLAARLLAARERAGLNQREASKAAGLAPGHVGTIERGEVASVSTKTAQSLANALGVSWQWLLTGDGDGPTATELPTERVRVYTHDADRYPNRDVAAKLLGGRVDRETIDALLTMQLDSDRDLTVAEWVNEARGLQAIRDQLSAPVEVEIDDAPRLPPKR